MRKHLTYISNGLAPDQAPSTLTRIAIQTCAEPLARQINSRLLNFSTTSIFKVLQCRTKLVKMLPVCQTAYIRVRRRVTQRLIRIQAVCIWDYGRDRQKKG